MALPKPVWSGDDINMAQRVVQSPSSQISRAWITWNKDPIKIAVLRAMVSCVVRPGYFGYFDWDMCKVLAQNPVCFLHPYSLEVEEVHHSTPFRTLTILVLSLRPCSNILISGDHLLAMFQRKTVKHLSADQICHTWRLTTGGEVNPFLVEDSKSD